MKTRAFIPYTGSAEEKVRMKVTRGTPLGVVIRPQRGRRGNRSVISWSLLLCLLSKNRNSPLVASSPASTHTLPPLSPDSPSEIQIRRQEDALFLRSSADSVAQEPSEYPPLLNPIPAFLPAFAGFLGAEKTDRDASVAMNERMRPIEALMAQDPAYILLQAKEEAKMRAKEKEKMERKAREKVEYEASVPPLFELDWSGGPMDLDSIIAADAEKGISWAQKALARKLHEISATEAVEMTSRIQFACNNRLQEIFRTAKTTGGFRLPNTGGNPYWQIPAIQSFMAQQLTREHVNLSIDDSELKKYVFRNESLPWNVATKSESTGRQNETTPAETSPAWKHPDSSRRKAHDDDGF
uniref:Uncharacterized protein n=1 Tax=Toxoplasma gondii COUG TaxID=1074873 RepID=A0A2G8Y8Y4_TOXGO|nr:hypothetical protein TGCOUG_212180 [Toxoplasma gondii COUG]